MQTYPICRLGLETLEPTALMPLCQRGFLLQTLHGVTLQDFLESTCGLSSEYIQNRIQTIFINGHPVDDPVATALDANSTVALSAAMPGLVGATMRSGGAFAALRNGISYASTATGADTPTPILVRLKLFNFLAIEVGTSLLQNGIIVSGPEFEEWLKTATGLWPSCREFSFDGQELPCTLSAVQDKQWPAYLQLELRTIT